MGNTKDLKLALENFIFNNTNPQTVDDEDLVLAIKLLNRLL